jgi:copper chaperone CopZ
MSTQSKIHESVFALQGLHCGNCVNKITQALAPHAQAVHVTLSPMQAVLTGSQAALADLQAAVASAGNYSLQPWQTAEIEEKVALCDS